LHQYSINLSREFGGTGFPACADIRIKSDGSLDILYKEHPEKLRVTNAFTDLQPAGAQAGKPVPPD
jgi:hypothetical protein